MLAQALLLTLFQVKHFVFDFLYQPRWQWANKGTYGHWGGIVHSLIHAVSTFFILWPLFIDAKYAFALACAEFMIHYHVDWAKMNINRVKGWGANTHEQFWQLLGADQLAHQLTYVGLILSVLVIQGY